MGCVLIVTVWFKSDNHRPLGVSGESPRPTASAIQIPKLLGVGGYLLLKPHSLRHSIVLGSVYIHELLHQR